MQLKPLCVLLQIDDPLQLCDLPEHSSKSLKKNKIIELVKGRQYVYENVNFKDR